MLSLAELSAIEISLEQVNPAPELKFRLAHAVLTGMKEGITRYAVWESGGQYVGVLIKRPLQEVLKQLDDEFMRYINEYSI